MNIKEFRFKQQENNIELGDYLSWCKPEDIVLIQCYNEDDMDGTLLDDMYKGSIRDIKNVELDMIVDDVNEKNGYTQIVVCY